MNKQESDILNNLLVEPFINQRILSETSGHSLVSLLWCILLIVLPIALVFSESSMNNIQSISIISAFPIGIIMIIMIWGFIKDIKIYMKKELKGKEWQNN